jgi:hypothetical protein
MRETPPLYLQLRPLLVAFLLLISGAGLATELVHSRSHAPLVELFVNMFSLSQEKNLPTWYSSCLLFSCALTLSAIVREKPLLYRGRWAILAAGFFYMSLDEAVEIHEYLGGLFGTGGVLYFDWVIPASLVVFMVGIIYWPFLWSLSAQRRRQFLLAGFLYVGGSVLMELPLGWWTEKAGAENVTYALIDWVEETLEMVGASYFLYSLLEHWHTRRATEINTQAENK